MTTIEKGSFALSAPRGVIAHSHHFLGATWVDASTRVTYRTLPRNL